MIEKDIGLSGETDFILLELTKVPLLISKFLPAAIMGVLVIYCYRNISFSDPGKALLEIVAGLVTLFIHLWKKNMPLSIPVGTGFYMVLLNLLG